MPSDDPQGRITFPGFEGQLSATFTDSLGINPSVLRVSLPPTLGLPKTGTIRLLYDEQLVREFPNSVVQPIEVSTSDGLTRWDVTILDRREAWRFGQITGEYNIRDSSDTVISSTKKSPRELAELCLEAMGELAIDVTALPENDFPYVDWDLTVPAKALADLVELYSCTIALLKDNSVKVVELGVGQDPPSEYLYQEIVAAVYNGPKTIRAVSAPVEYQFDLRLRAVGLNAETGEYEPIEDLDYEPEDGWSKTPFTFYSEIGDEQHRRLAKEHIFRSYRVEIDDLRSADALPDLETLIKNREQILPLVNRLNLKETIEGVHDFKPSIVYGRFVTGDSPGVNNVDEFAGPEAYKASLEYEKGFSVDEDKGIVHFSQPVYIEGDDTEGYLPADIYLRCVIHVRDKDTRGEFRLFKTKDLDLTRTTQEEFIPREDVVPRYFQDADEGVGEWKDNKKEVEEELDFFLTQNAKSRQVQDQATYSCEGFLDIQCDGVIRQLTYSVDGQGFATTQVEQNRENPEVTITLKEARERQKVTDLLKDRDKRQRVRKLRDERRKIAREMRRKQ